GSRPTVMTAALPSEKLCGSPSSTPMPAVVVPTMVAPLILRSALANSSAPPDVLPFTRQTIGRVTSLSSETRRSSVVPSLAWLWRSEEHTSELQSRFDLVCRLLLEKKK